MKNFLLLIFMIFITNVANAKTEYYISGKVGIGDSTIYADDNNKLGDYLVQVFEENPDLNADKYTDSGLLWEISAAVGLDWSPGKMYVKQTPYEWFHLRLEGEFGYNNYHEYGKLRYDYTVTGDVKVKTGHFFALANGYADFRIDNFVPYIGLGIGYGFGNEEITVKGITVSDELFTVSDSADDSGVIYALHLGIGYKYSDITTLDLGARRVYAPAEDDGMYIFDSIRLGARFRI